MIRIGSLVLGLSLLLGGCGAPESGHAAPTATAKTGQIEPAAGQEAATFAGGCFWCMVAPFAELPGVVSVTSGYSGGRVANPSYEQVSHGNTGHAEAVQIVFDPKVVTYDKLLSIFWRSIDPTDAAGQFCDIGSQYRTAVFFHGAAQKQQALVSRDALAAAGTLGAPIVTEITEFTAFYPAEDYHQDFYRKQELRYQGYRAACGRDAALRRLHGKEAMTSH